jgi:hypothetical protein
MALIPLFTSSFFAILNDPVLNDLEQFLNENNAIGLISLTEDLEQELDTYLKLFILLYADDTVILAESSDDMQNFLKILSQDKKNVQQFSTLCRYS